MANHILIRTAKSNGYPRAVCLHTNRTTEEAIAFASRHSMCRSEYTGKLLWQHIVLIDLEGNEIYSKENKNED